MQTNTSYRLSHLLDKAFLSIKNMRLCYIELVSASAYLRHCQREGFYNSVILRFSEGQSYIMTYLQVLVSMIASPSIRFSYSMFTVSVLLIRFSIFMLSILDVMPDFRLQLLPMFPWSVWYDVRFMSCLAVVIMLHLILLSLH